MKLWDHIKEKMLRHPFQTVCEDNAEMTFEELVVFAELFADRLKGISSCAILCRSEMAAAMALLSCIAGGVTAVPLSNRYGEKHCRKIFDTISPEAVITDAEGGLNIEIFSDSSYIEPNERPALIMCTSGTTGFPKGAMLTENNIMTNLSDIVSYFEIGPTDSILIARPLYHCAVLTGEFLTALVNGVKILFYSGEFNPIRVLHLLEENRITVFCGTPTLLSMMARIKRDDYFSSLKHICVSGECMSRNVGQRISEAFPESRIYHVYGLTEASPRVAYLPPALFDLYPGYVGIPLDNVSVKIADDNGNELKSGEKGILWVKGPNIMMGYYNDPEMTDKAIKEGWLCTNDIAIQETSGLIRIIGRRDDLIIKAGMNIYPQEIEKALRVDPRVCEVCVYGCNDSKNGTQIVLNIVGDFENVSDVRVLCRELLPPYQIPTQINLVDELPKNGSGKIIRR